MGVFDVVLGRDAICTAEAVGTQRITSMRTRYPTDAILTLIQGHATCTVAGRRFVPIGDGSVLNPDGTVRRRGTVGELSSLTEAVVQVVVEYDSQTGRTLVRARGAVLLVLADGREFIVRDGQLLTIDSAGAPPQTTQSALGPADAALLDEQRRVLP